MSLSRPARGQEDRLQQLTASSASEIVKAARAYLKDPTRPVTPLGGGRQLLQSDGYFNRPPTAGDLLCSRDFLCSSDTAADSRRSSTHAAASDCISTAPWCSTSNSEIAAEIWTADSTPHYQNSSAKQLPSIRSRQSSSVLGDLPRLRCSSAADCGSPSPLRPTSALSAATLGGSKPTLAGISHCGIDSTPSLSTASSLKAGQGLAVSAIGSERAAASADGLQTGQQAAEGCCNRINGSSSRGSSRTGSEASSRATSASTGHPEAAGAWQQQVLQAVHVVNSLSIEPSATNASALLHACAGLQSLLDVAEDQQHLQDRLDAPVQDSLAADTAGPAAAGSTTAVAANALPLVTLPQIAGAGATLRASVLSCLIRLVDCLKADVLVKVGSMMLRTIPLQSRMMLTAAKMLYKLSKDSCNDARFRRHGVLRPLLSAIALCSKAPCLLSVQQADHSSTPQILQAGDQIGQQQQQKRHKDGTVLLYLAGCLKNVSADAANQKCLGRLGAVATMAQVLIDHTARYPHSQQQQQQQQDHESAAQICVQATAVLRNLAIDQKHMQLFVEQQGFAIASLLGVPTVFEQEEVLMNLSRCLSKLSLDAQCRNCIITLGSLTHHICSTSSSCSTSAVCSQPPSSTAAVAQLFGIMLQPKLAASSQWGVILRIAFALGNLTTHHPEARQQIAAVPGAFNAWLQLMLDLLQELQTGQHQHPHQHPLAVLGEALPSSKASHKPVEDLLVKLLRLLGNVAIDSSAGAQLAAKQAAVDVVLGVLSSCSFDEHEELVLNAAAALSNLAFYSSATNKFLLVDATSLLQPMLPLLTSSSVEAATEASRAISNLARGSIAVVAELLHWQQPGAADSVYEELSPSGCGVQCLAGDSAAVLSQGTGSDCSMTNLILSGTVGPFVLQALVLLLGHSNWEVVSSAAGVLVNLTAARDSGPVLQKADLAIELKESLQNCGAALHACIQFAGTEADSTGQQQQPVALPCHMLEAAEVLLQCVHNLTTSGLAPPAAAGGEGNLEHSAMKDNQQRVLLDSCCCGASMVSVLQMFQEKLLEARSICVLVPDSLKDLVDALQERLTSSTCVLMKSEDGTHRAHMT